MSAVDYDNLISEYTVNVGKVYICVSSNGQGVYVSVVMGKVYMLN